MTDREDFMARYDRERQEATNNAKAKLKALLPELAKLGISSVVVSYDGSGDNGEIEEIRFENKKGESINVIDYHHNSIEALMYDFLPSGWEINDGSYGKFTIDVKNGKINHQHNERVESVETSDDEIDL